MLSAAKLRALMPRCDARTWFGPLSGAMAARAINTPLREAAFLAQAAVESKELTELSENLVYTSPNHLRATFPTHFDPLDDDDAWGFIRQPERIASRVYGGRMGNGPEASGDGWRYRGRGIFQLTGRDNYRAYGAEADPDRVAKPAGAADSACWFWDNRGLSALADAGDLQGITRKVNGGLNGWTQRKRYYDIAKGLLSS